MSVNITVARTRSGSATERAPVRNSSISPSTASESPAQGTWSIPGNSTYRAQLYEALEGYRVEALPWAQARVRIFHFLKRMGLGGAQPIRRRDTPGQGLLFPGS